MQIMLGVQVLYVCVCVLHVDVYVCILFVCIHLVMCACVVAPQKKNIHSHTLGVSQSLSLRLSPIAATSSSDVRTVLTDDRVCVCVCYAVAATMQQSACTKRGGETFSFSLCRGTHQTRTRDNRGVNAINTIHTRNDRAHNI